MPLIDLLQK